MAKCLETAPTKPETWPDLSLDNIRVPGNRLIVRRRPKEEVSNGGIVLPESAQEDYQMARVLARGSDVTSAAQAGDVILYAAYAVQDMKWLGEGVIAIDADDVLLIIPAVKESKKCPA